MIILRERIGNAELGEVLLIVGLHEEPARVAKNLRAQLPDARNGEFIFLQRVHAFMGILRSPERKH